MRRFCLRGAEMGSVHAPCFFWLENRTDNRMPKREESPITAKFYMMTVKTPKPVGFGVFCEKPQMLLANRFLSINFTSIKEKAVLMQK